MDLEALWYECFPYVIGICGMVALLIRGGSGLLKGSGVLLIAAAVTIVRVRRAYRRNAFLKTPAAGDLAGRMSAED